MGGGELDDIEPVYGVKLLGENIRGISGSLGYRRGVVTGCGNGNYCPAVPVTREQLCVFLTVTFGLTLYGP